MIEFRNFSPRQYQESIFQTCKDHNTLVVLETGLGKTALALMLAREKLNKEISQKVIILAPSRPLIAQHYQTFKEKLNLDKEDLALITGKIQPKQRQKDFKNALIVFSTPQCVNNDVKKGRISLENVSAITFDEAHHAMKNYAYVNIARKYKQQNPQGHILALTASPGNTQDKIREICNNLSIEKVEIRTEQDEDVKPYIQEKKVSWISVDLDKKLLGIIANVKQTYTSKLRELKKLGVTKPVNLINKKDLLDLQIKFRRELQNKNQIAYYGLSLTAQIIKLSHLIDLLETQGIETAQKYVDKLSTETTKAAQSIVSNASIKQAHERLKEILNESYKHPKIRMLLAIIKNQILEKPESKTIVFANFRDTIDEILKEMKKIEQIRPVALIGQKEGLSQKEQVQVIKQFEENKYNTLICTSIGEEGLSIGTLEIAIFYDSVPSAIRRIQRTGRVARTQPGKIIHIIASNTRDSAYYWKSQRDEKRMKSVLYSMQNKQETQKTLHET